MKTTDLMHDCLTATQTLQQRQRRCNGRSYVAPLRTSLQSEKKETNGHSCAPGSTDTHLCVYKDTLLLTLRHADCRHEL